MNVGDDVIDLELVKDLLFLKSLFLGGREEYINSDEIVGFIQKLYPIITSSLDLLYVNDLDVITTKKNILIILETVRNVKSSLFPHPSSMVVTTHSKLLNVIDKTLGELLPFNIFEVEESVVNFKKNILSVETKESTNYQYKDIKRVFNWGEELLERLYFNSVTWEYFESEMKSEGPIRSLPFEDLPDYMEVTRTKVFDYWKDYLHIAKTFRTFQSPSGLQYFTNDYQRYLGGFNIISGIRFGLQKVLPHYGPPFETHRLVKKSRVPLI